MSEAKFDLEKLLNTVSKLREECPWDKKQTHETLARHLIEEAYEVIDAISNIDREDSYIELKTELGDLLFQILLHSKIAEEKEEFSIEDVFLTLNQKLTERHPHVFGDASFDSADDVEKAWEIRKQESRKNKSIFDDIQENLSSLELAAKAQRKAKSIGLSYNSIEDAVKDFLSEVGEFKSAGSLEKQRQEFGDILFSLVNISRFLETDSELELRKAVKRFIFRAKYVELEKDSSQKDLHELWSEAKKKEKSIKEG